MLQRALDRLGPFPTVVFDLDGTLVRLDVEWAAAREAMIDLAARRFKKAYKNRTVWGMLRDSMGEERATLDELLRSFEIEGGRRAQPLPLAGLPPLLRDKRLGVVTLNSRASSDAALAATGLDAFIEVTVAREDADRFKPDPEPLLLCIARLDGRPAESVFVGDRERDRQTARNAGAAYEAVEVLLRS